LDAKPAASSFDYGRIIVQTEKAGVSQKTHPRSFSSQVTFAFLFAA
jgi:hypothetical protein